MKKTHLALLIAASTLATTAQANGLGNLQGYYKSKAAIGYSASKIQQNKIEFMNLDAALKLNASTSPQDVGDMDSLASSKSAHQGIYKKYADQFKLSSEVCVVSKDGAKIAFEADAGTTVCKFDINSIHKAMASSSKGLTFFKRLGTGADMQYQIDNITADGETITTTFLFKFNGQLVGDVAVVAKDSSDKYTVEHFADYGKESAEKIGYRSFQWVESFSVSAPITVNSVAYLYGSKVSIGDKLTPLLWAIKDTVVAGMPSKPFIVSHVKRMQKSTDGQTTSKDNYSNVGDSKDDLIRYNFNNAHNLVGLSLDSCTIKQIAAGKDPVTWYKGYPRREDCGATANDAQAKQHKITSSTVTNDDGKKIPVSSLATSALNIRTSIDALSAGSEVKMTEIEFDAMVIKYTLGMKKYSKFNSIEFWK